MVEVEEGVVIITAAVVVVWEFLVKDITVLTDMGVPLRTKLVAVEELGDLVGLMSTVSITTTVIAIERSVESGY